MSSIKKKSGPADEQRNITLTLYPWTTHTVATVDLAHRDSAGVHRSRLAYWHLRVTRAELAGRSADHVLRLLIDGLVRHLDGDRDPADCQATGDGSATAVGPGAPVGATGATVIQDSLPGM